MNFWSKMKLVKDYKDVFSTEAGQRVLADLSREGGILKNTYSGDVDLMMLKEGKRNIVLYVLSILKTDLAKVLEMHETLERQSKEEAND